MKTNLQLRYFQDEVVATLTGIAGIICLGFEFNIMASCLFFHYAFLETRIIYFFWGKFNDAETKQTNTIGGYQPIKRKGKSRPPRRD